MTTIDAAVKPEPSMQVCEDEDVQNDSQDDEEQRVNFSGGEDDGHTTTGLPFTFSHLPVGMMGGSPNINPMQQLMGFGGAGSMSMMNPAMMMQMMMAGGMGFGRSGGVGIGSGMHPAHTAAAQASTRSPSTGGPMRANMTPQSVGAHTVAAATNLPPVTSSAAPSTTSTNPSLRSHSSPTNTSSTQQQQQLLRHPSSSQITGGTVTGTPLAEFAQQWQMQQQQQSAMYCWWQQQQMYMTNMYATSSGSFSAMQGPAAAATFSSMPPAVQEMMHKMSASNSMLAASGLAHSAAAATGGSLIGGSSMPPWMLAATAAAGGGSHQRAGTAMGPGSAAAGGTAGGSDGSDDDDEHDGDEESPGMGTEASGIKRALAGGMPGSPVPKRGRRCTKEQKICKNCFTVATPFWRKDKNDGKPLCNACGLYFSKNDAPRPKVLWKNDEQQQGQGLVIGANGVATPTPCNAGSSGAYSHDAAAQLSQLQQSALQHMQHQQMMMFSQQRAAAGGGGAMMMGSGVGGMKAFTATAQPTAAAAASRSAHGVPNILARPSIPPMTTQTSAVSSSQTAPQSTIQAMVQKAKQQHLQQQNSTIPASTTGIPAFRTGAPAASTTHPGSSGLAPTVTAMAKANASAAPRLPSTSASRPSPFTTAAGSAAPSPGLLTTGKSGILPVPPFVMNPLMGPLGFRAPLPGLMSPTGASALFAGLGIPLNMPMNMQAMVGMPNISLLPKHLFPAAGGMHLPPPTLSAMLAAATAAAVAAGQPSQPGQQQPNAGSAVASMQASMLAAFTNANQHHGTAAPFSSAMMPQFGLNSSLPFPAHLQPQAPTRAHVLTPPISSLPSTSPAPASTAAAAAKSAAGATTATQDSSQAISNTAQQHSCSQPMGPPPTQSSPGQQQQAQQQSLSHQLNAHPLSMWLPEQQTQTSATAAAVATSMQPPLTTAPVAVATHSPRHHQPHQANHNMTLDCPQLSLWAPSPASLAHPLA